MQEIQDALEGDAEDLGLEAIPALVAELVETAEAEGLATQLGAYYVAAAQAYWSRGDLGRAREYAARALESWVEFGGEDDEDVPVIRGVVKHIDQLLAAGA